MGLLKIAKVCFFIDTLPGTQMIIFIPVPVFGVPEPKRRSTIL